LKLKGEENSRSLQAADYYAKTLIRRELFEEAKALLRKIIPVARRVLGADYWLTLGIRGNYAIALYKDDGATLDDLRENVAMLEDADRIARRVLGGAHPTAVRIAECVEESRMLLRARETPSESV